MTQHLSWSTSDVRIVTAQTRGHRWLYFACKRLLDISVAAGLLIVLSPVMLTIALLIVLDTPGPAIFRQQRVGLRKPKGGVPACRLIGTFTFYKFRTMYEDTNSEIHRAFVQAFIRKDSQSMGALQGTDSSVQKLVDDPRVTRLGRLLRKSSLDELPQLWNVLRGDMSLVGPRPPIPYEVDMYEPWHWQRLQGQPGMTGLWQVSARSSADFDEMVQLDIQYLNKQSMWLDLMILLRTPCAVVLGRGAV